MNDYDAAWNAAGAHAESLRQTIREQEAEIARLRALPPGWYVGGAAVAITVDAETQAAIDAMPASVQAATDAAMRIIRGDDEC